jgi:hypothetical protein
MRNNSKRYARDDVAVMEPEPLPADTGKVAEIQDILTGLQRRIEAGEFKFKVKPSPPNIPFEYVNNSSSFKIEMPISIVPTPAGRVNIILSCRDNTDRGFQLQFEVDGGQQMQLPSVAQIIETAKQIYAEARAKGEL